VTPRIRGLQFLAKLSDLKCSLFIPFLDMTGLSVIVVISTHLY
jgi:hypothetical protein